MNSFYPSSAEYLANLPPPHRITYYQCPRCDAHLLHPDYLSPDQPARFLLYIDLIISFLCLLPTLGITKFYYSLFRYNPANAAENRAERGCALPSLPINLYWDEEILERIALIWSACLGLSYGGVLASVMGFVQLLSVRNNPVFTTLVLGACVLSWSSTICGFLYTGYKKSFLTPRIAEQWVLVSGFSQVPFWRLLALPVILLAWGFIFCFIATIYVSFTGFNNAPPSAAPLTAVGGLFVLGIFALCAALIYNAAKSLDCV
ncbi:hypothetical protein BJ912DRAFT_966085 [Pholiota molesta]|nr:hypothetical protein BJ912DRAFT_966085 [Pholiota molesta]